jgi:D-amino-acid dehydrogenase
MKIIILGSGVLGVTTAYELGKRGFDVTVIDRQPHSGAETSYANGGQLSYSHGEPWASPSVLHKLPKWLFRDDAPLALRPRADMAMIGWGLQFLRNCTENRASVNCANILRLGLYSRERMAAIRADTAIAFDYNDNGILHIFSSEDDFSHARHHNDFQAKFGCEQRVLTRDEVLALEPALNHTSRNIVGGIHSVMDESGDAFLFCNALAKIATERYGVTFRYGVTINALRSEKQKITAVSTDQGDMTADGFVMAMGSYSPVYLKPLGIKTPIYPMKGYSLTLEANDACPRISITDGTYKIVYSRLGSRLRIAGTAEFAGYNTSINEKRVRPIIASARALLPQADWNQDIGKWACLRPSTPDGPPIMGHTPYRNLFLNTGHGTLGWTQAAGSATIVADLMERKLPAIMLHGLTLERYN